ncbi:O-succinylbenzoic acid--CoA ligase [Halomicrobium zhouii]|uniref:O-succinylbenzoic acid--CoA ligase n=1 Tax=Halomicrobium zhouii TaxID=767519 RepID=A0A1I6LV95_9EURY|nr:AMP-binding protein [Halomicrobium zhouii]SFS07373.1 O-succinylbenzoic acid--CoA ligase [Halomicrobium zhouii]
MTLPGPGEWPVDAPLDYPTADLLGARAEATPDETALVDAESGDCWRYGEFDRRVARRLAGLQSSFDLGPGDRVGFMLNTGVRFAELYFATARAGAAAVLLNVRVDAGTLATQASRAGLDVLVCSADTETTAVDVAPDGVHVVTVDEPNSPAVDALAPGSGDEATPVDCAADAERLLMFTSGTTGDPKGVRLTLDNLVSSAVGSAHRLGVAPDDRWLVCLPMYHMGGLAPLVRSTLYGTTTVLQSEFDPDATARVIEDHNVTCVSLVPTMLKRLLDAGWTPPDHLRFVLLGGGPTPESLVDRCESRGVPVCPTYGATETASQVATALPETAFEHRGTVGTPLRGTTVTIVDDSEEPRPTGDVGEIVVDGPTVTPGYLDEEHTAVAFGPRGFETGDLGYRDEGGRLWVVGRVDDQIVTGGENVQPAAVAATIRELAGVEDVAVVGIPDREWGERVGALVERSDATLSVSELRDRCRDELADYEVPKTVRFAEALPRTASGTVDRERARSLLAEE